MTNIRRLQDIQINDVDLIEIYKDTFENESIEEAQSLINDASVDANRLKSYVLQSEWMNAVKTKIEDLEKNKSNEFDDTINSITNEFQNNINEFLYINVYSGTTQYYKNNFVLYNNEIYYCIQNSLNNVPTNTDYWVRIGLRGEKGQYSLGINYRGIWNYNTEYRIYDLVVFDDNLYIAKKNNIHSYPNSANPDPYPDRPMYFLNNSLYLGNNVYIRNARTGDDWFLLTKPDDKLKIYDSPVNYKKLPIHSIFFQKL